MIYSVGRGASEFNESQKQFTKTYKTYKSDCFTFEAAQNLSDGQIDIMMKRKRKYA